MDEPEYCRAFVCPQCQELLTPSPGSWKCASCQKDVGADAQERILAAERDAEANPPTSLTEITALVAKRVLHEQHYIIFFIMQEFARELSGSSTLEDCRVALELWIKLNACLDRVLPPFHNSRVLCLDMLAQVKLKLGDSQGSASAFSQAYKISQ